VGNVIEVGKAGLGGHVYRHTEGERLLVGINNANDSETDIRYLYGNEWITLFSVSNPNIRLNYLNFLNECYIAGRDDATNTYMDMRNINSALDVSTTRNLIEAPRAKFITDYNGQLYAINVEVNGVKHKDRAYRSSAPTGAVAFVQGDYNELRWEIDVDSAKYLKPGMKIDIYKAGTGARIVDSLEIVSVDKENDQITFSPQVLTLTDNDEIWLEDRKDKLTIFWNTDNPTPETSDWIRIPAGIEASPEFTGFGFNNNKMLLFGKNSIYKWDGSSLTNISTNIGCVSHETIHNIGPWTFWLHTTGVWAYNDATSQFRLVSRTIENYIRAINQSNLSKATAVISGRVYKLSVGEIAELDSVTTSTSTSSTSTSSTSSSTSSTSTSSTSTSLSTSSTSTSSTSISTSSTSTSSSSISTSSTSTSSTSTSISTSSTSSSISTSSSTSTSASTSTSTSSVSTSTSSTSTSTVASTKDVVRLIYDYDMNAWWPEYHNREFRSQFTHTMHGYTKPYFQDETGRLFRDETTHKDHNRLIPFEVETGRNHLNSSSVKSFVKCVVYSTDARGAYVTASIDGGAFLPVGQITKSVQELEFKNPPLGRDINYKFTHNSDSGPPIIDGVDTHFASQEAPYGLDKK